MTFAERQSKIPLCRSSSRGRGASLDHGRGYLTVVDAVVEAYWNNALLMVTTRVGVARRAASQCVGRCFTAPCFFEKGVPQCSIVLVPRSRGRTLLTPPCIAVSRIHALCRAIRGSTCRARAEATPVPCAPVACGERVVSRPAATVPPVDEGMTVRYCCALSRGLSLKASTPREEITAEGTGASRACWVRHREEPAACGPCAASVF